MNTSVILAVLLASLATVGFGVGLLKVVGFKPLPTTLMLGAGYGVGVVVISQLLHLASYADVGLSMAGWCLVCLGLAACVWLVRAELIPRNITPPETAEARYVGFFRSRRIGAQDPVVAALSVLVAAHLVITLTNNALRPVFPWDAFTTWMYRAKAWALQDGITTLAFTPDWIHEPTASGYAIYASQYPTALSIYAAFLSSLTGGWQPAAASAPWSLALAASGLTLHGILRLAGISQRLSVIGAYLLVSLPLLNVHAALAGYGDLWMALYSGSGLAALLIWRTTHRANALWLGFALLGAGTQIKTEGWVWLLLGLTFLLLEAISNRIGYIKLVAGIVALAGLIWSLDITLLSLGPLGQWGIDDSRLYAGAIGSFNLRPYNPATNYWAILFDQANFLLMAGFYVLALVAISLKRDQRYLGSVWSMSLLIAGSQIIIFGLSSYSEYAETGTAMTRLLLHFSPVVVVTVIVGWSYMTGADGDANIQARETAPLTASRSKQWAPLVLVTALSAAFLVPLTALLLNKTSPSLTASNKSMTNVVGQIENTNMGTRFLASPINVGVLKAPGAVSAPPPRYLIADLTAPDSESISLYWINSGETQVNSTPVNLSGRSVIDLDRYGAWRSGGKKELGFLVQSQAFEQSYLRGFSLTDTLSTDIIPALLNHWSAAEPLTQATINNTRGHAESAVSLVLWVNGGLVFVAALGALLIRNRQRASYQVLVGGSLIGLWLTVDAMTLASTPMLDCLTAGSRCLTTSEADPHARGLIKLAKELKANTPIDKPIIIVNAGDSLGAQKLPLLLLPKAGVYVSSHEVPADWAFDVVVLGNNAEALNDTALSLENKLVRNRVIDLKKRKVNPRAHLMSGQATDSRPKRILHIGKYFPPHRGGMETVLRDQMNMQIRDEGLQVAAVVHSSERRLTDIVEITELGYRIRRSARWFTAIFAPIAPFFWWSVAREIRELDPDEVKIHMPNLSAFWLLAIPSARARKWVMLWHSDVLPSRHSFGLRCFYGLYKPFEWLLLQRADQIIATSPPYLESSKPLSRFREKCIVEPLKLDKDRIPARFLAAPQPAKKPGEGIRVLCVGRLTYYKSFDTAIKAIAHIPTAQLRIVGDGELRETLQELVYTLGLEERVTLLGEVEDEVLWQQYVWCDVHCLPSIERTEAFGLVILEAAAFGKPSVVADISGSGAPWIASIAHSKGQNFRLGDPVHLAESLPGGVG